MAGLGVAFLSAHTVAVELADGRLISLDVVGLPVERQWFIVRLARRRVLPAAAALRQFLIDEGKNFLPTLEAAMKPSGKRQRKPEKRTKSPAKRARKAG
jgi:hypothetical protein